MELKKEEGTPERQDGLTRQQQIDKTEKVGRPRPSYHQLYQQAISNRQRAVSLDSTMEKPDGATGSH